MISSADGLALLLTLKLAAISTSLLLFICTPLAWWLAHTKWRGKFLLEALIALPLVLPPTVIGFYLLVAFSPNSLLGESIESMTGVKLAFSFTGLVIGSVIYSLPFVVQPLQNTFAAIGRHPAEVASTLGASRTDAFFSVVLPLARSGFFTAAVLGFAHTVGEFGVVLMIGGNIPGETRVASIAIYDHVESLNYAGAHTLAAILLIASFLMLMTLFAFNRNRPSRLLT